MAHESSSGSDYSTYDDTENSSHEVAPDLAYKRLAIVNVVLFGSTQSVGQPWVLIDAGLPKTAGLITKAAEERFGKSARPAAIIMTHGHFDHVGALKELAERWDVPIYAHTLEHPYLDGRASYPPPDPNVGGGLMARLSSFYPKGPIDVSRWLKPLPDDGSVPGMPGWRWFHTPGHTPGHISLWREADRLLIAGDAFVTTKQESAYAVAVQKPEVHGPPMYYTPDWQAAETSVEQLATLEPEIVVTGHGSAMNGPSMREALKRLARDFKQRAVPRQGRYVDKPAKADERGPTYVPPKKLGSRSSEAALAGALIALVGGWLIYQGVGGRKGVPKVRVSHSRGESLTDAPEVERSLTIGKSAAELYRAWREPQNLSRIMGHFAEVTATKGGGAHWRVDGPLGQKLVWETRVVEDRPNEYLRWTSLEGSTLPNEGSIRFRPAAGDRGTEVTLNFLVDPPGGVLGDAASKLLHTVPKTLVIKTLRRFKSLVETGEIPTLERNPSARGRGDVF